MGIPVEVNNLMLGSLGGYTVGRSLRFRSSATAYLNRTFTTPTNNKIWTWSGWVKRGALGVTSYIMEGYPATAGNANDRTQFYFTSGDALEYSTITTGTTTELVTTTQVFRDPSAWYHIIIVCDTTQATASNRLKFYVNGVQITTFSNTTYPALNANPYIDAAKAHYIGAAYNGSLIGGVYLDGYLAEVNFIDGQALTPSSFGETDSITGVWNPKKYSGTYGTNGFYLNFSDNSAATAAAIGKDYSGNGNNWTPNNISVTSGTTYDSMIDSPTNTAGTSYGVGNYCVLNPLKSAGSNGVNSGNLNFGTSSDGASNSGDNSGVFGSIAVDSGKWYFEGTKLNTTTNCNLIAFASTNCIIGSDDPGTLASGKDFFGFTWNSGGTVRLLIRQGGVSTNVATGITQSQNDVFALAIDLTNNTLAGYKNGVQQGSTTSFTATTNLIAPCLFQKTTFNYAGFAFNFGQRPFSYTPPSGFKALNTYNLPAASISNGAKHFAATTYTGTGSALSVSNAVNGIGFQPDFVWMKKRSAASSHYLQDSVRGSGVVFYSDQTAAENAIANGITSFNSSGFSLGTNADVNGSGASQVAWQWKGGGTAVTNNSGTISSQVSANTSAGISIITYTGSGANATVGHGLGVAPNMIIVKTRSLAGENWNVYNSNLVAGNVVQLNNTIASSASTITFTTTLPTSSVFSVGTNTGTNGSGSTYVAYCFSAVRGFSAFGSYTGNGSADGPFVFTNMRPRFVMVKRIDTSGTGWQIHDTSRNTYNVMNNRLQPNNSDAESTYTTSDFLSNGFKLRDSDASWNASGGTYIYAAFAENPFNISRAR